MLTRTHCRCTQRPFPFCRGGTWGMIHKLHFLLIPTRHYFSNPSASVSILARSIIFASLLNFSAFPVRRPREVRCFSVAFFHPPSQHEGEARASLAHACHAIHVLLQLFFRVFSESLLLPV